MKLMVYLKTGKVLQFNNRDETSLQIEALYEYAVCNKTVIPLACTNGDFFINPHDISYMHVLPDNPLEPDQE